jgi:hypothetical protein
MPGYSVRDVQEFLDYCSDKGLLKRNTAISRKTAVAKVLGGLDVDEQTDVRLIDLDAAFDRWQNRQGGDYDPASLGVYQSRMNMAIKEFLRFRSDPKSYRPKSGRPPAVSTPGRRLLGEPRTLELGPEDDMSLSASVPEGTPALLFSVPVRPGVVASVRIAGLPQDLTRSEATAAARAAKGFIEAMILAAVPPPLS